MAGETDDVTAIFQDWLDRAGQFIFARDFTAFSRIVAQPCVVSTRERRVVLDDDASLRTGFDAWCDTLEGHRATDMIRTAKDVRRVSRGIGGLYDTHILRGAARVVPVFTSWMLLVPEDGRWFCAHLVSGLANRRFPFSVLQVDPSAPVAAPPGDTADGAAPPGRA